MLLATVPCLPLLAQFRPWRPLSIVHETGVVAHAYAKSKPKPRGGIAIALRPVEDAPFLCQSHKRTGAVP